MLRAGRIAGVRLADDSEIEADLVIDASGRSSYAPRFLQDHGLPAPAVTELPVNIGYASQIFRPGPAARDWRGMLIHSSPPATRTAALMPLEDGNWIVTLVGWNGDLPAVDGGMNSFMDWARGLPAPDLFRAIADAEPVDRVWRWNFVSNLRRHYERLRTLPEGLVVVGDANTSLRACSRYVGRCVASPESRQARRGRRRLVTPSEPGATPHGGILAATRGGGAAFAHRGVSRSSGIPIHLVTPSLRCAKATSAAAIAVA